MLLKSRDEKQEQKLVSDILLEGGEVFCYIEPIILPLQKAFDQLFKELGIKGKPIPVEDLQKMMGELGLEPNELSQAITAAREE